MAAADGPSQKPSLKVRLQGVRIWGLRRLIIALENCFRKGIPEATWLAQQPSELLTKSQIVHKLRKVSELQAAEGYSKYVGLKITTPCDKFEDLLHSA